MGAEGMIPLVLIGDEFAVEQGGGDFLSGSGGLAGFAVFQIIPDKLLAIFGAKGEMLDIGIPALRIISIIFIVAGFSIVSISTLQAMGRGFDSLIISIARQLVVLLPVAWGLSLTGNVDMIWWAFPIAELFAVTMSAFLLRRMFRRYRLVKPRGEVK